MASSRKRRASSASIAFGTVAFVAILLFAALSGAWYYLAGRLESEMDEAIRAAAANGLSIACEDRTIFGYPFRIGVHCDSIAVDGQADALQVAGGALRTAAQIYDPTKLVAKLDAPVYLDTPALPPLDIGWDLAQASANFRSDGLGRVSVAIDSPAVSVAGPDAEAVPLVRSQEAQLHLRQREGDLDLALADRAVVVPALGNADVPPFDLSADLTVAGAAGWLNGGLAGRTIAEALAGRSGTIRSLQLATADEADGQAGAELSGPFSFSEEGLLSGEFHLAVADPQQIAEIVREIVPGMAGLSSTIASALSFAGRQEDGRSVIEITVDDGAVSVGFIPLGAIPPIL